MADDPKQTPAVPRGNDDVKTGTAPGQQGAKDDPSKAPERGDRKATG